jgi:rod shape determining protein RodA
MSPSSQYKFLRQAPRDGLSTAMQPSRGNNSILTLGFVFFILNALLGFTVLYSASAQDVGLVSKQAMSFGIGFAVMISWLKSPQSLSSIFTLFLCVWCFP